MLIRSIFLFLFSAVAFFFLYIAQKKLTTLRQRYTLTEERVYRDMPPVIAFTTIAFGGFRGLAADILFLRLEDMQEQQRFFEMMQLASWIIKLQPDFTGVTTFLSWNLSYNVSVLFPNPQDRWRWVQHGIELIRDEGITYHPGSPTLYRELSWLYYHKIGQDLDDAHLFYKLQLAKEIMLILGKQDAPYPWDIFAETPMDNDGLKHVLGENNTYLQTTLNKHNLTMKSLEEWFRKNHRFPDALSEELKHEGIDVLLGRFFRIRQLKEELKLDPQRIHTLITRYGYLDFRLPDAHAIYWADAGLRHAPNQQDISCERMLFQSLKSAFFSGRLLYIDHGENTMIQTTPNIALADAVQDAYLESIAKHPENRSIVDGYKNFMNDAILILYTFSQKKKARSFLHRMRRKYGKKEEKYQKNLDTFVMEQLAGNVKAMSREQAQSLVQSFLLQSYKSLAFREYNRSSGFDFLARKIYAHYMREMKGDRDKMRRGLPEYNAIKQQCLQYMDQVFPAIIKKRVQEERTEFSRRK